MDVTWTIEPAGGGTRVDIEHDFRPRVPGFAAFVDRAFTRPIAGRTLATFKALAEALAADDVRRGRRDESPAHDPLTTRRRRAFITGIGVLSRHRHRAARRSGPGSARTRSPVKRIDRFDPVAVPLAGRGPGRRLRAARPHGRPGGARRSTGSASSGSRPAGWRWPTRASCPGRAARPAGERIGIYLGSALGGIAFAELAARAVPRPRAAGRLPDPRARGVRRRRAGQPRASRSTSAARSCRPPTRAPRAPSAIGEALNAIRDGEIDAADRRRRGVPAVAARVRGVRPDPRPGPRLQRRPAARRPADGRAAATASSWARARRCSSSSRRTACGPAARRRTPRCWATAPPRTPTTWSSRGPTAREAARAATLALADAGTSRRTRSTGSAPTRPRRRSATSPRPAPSRAALGDRAATVPVSATKALTGHPLGATGAIEAAMAALAIRDGFVPGSCNLEAPEPELDGAPAGPPPRGLRGPLRARALDLVRVRRAQRRARAGRAGLVSRGRAGCAGTLRAMSDVPAWERRFRAPLLSFPPGPPRTPTTSSSPPPRAAPTSSTRGTGEPATVRQVTRDPVGVLEGRPTRDGSGVIWFRDETGDETGDLGDRAVRDEPLAPEPLLQGLPRGWSRGARARPAAHGRGHRHGRGVHGLGLRRRRRRPAAPQARPAGPPRRRLGPRRRGRLGRAVGGRRRSSCSRSWRTATSCTRPCARSTPRPARPSRSSRTTGWSWPAFAFSPVPGDLRIAITHERTRRAAPGPVARPDRRAHRPRRRPDRHRRARRLVARRLGAAAARPRGRAATPSTATTLADGAASSGSTPSPARSRPPRSGPTAPSGTAATTASTRRGCWPCGATTPLLEARRPAPRPAGRPFEAWWFDNPHGQRVHGFLVRPDGDGPYPVIMRVHGGPHSLDMDRWAPDILAHVDAGFLVAMVNYRGSEGFGQAWRDELTGQRRVPRARGRRSRGSTTSWRAGSRTRRGSCSPAGRGAAT